MGEVRGVLMINLINDIILAILGLAGFGREIRARKANGLAR